MRLPGVGAKVLMALRPVDSGRHGRLDGAGARRHWECSFWRADLRFPQQAAPIGSTVLFLGRAPRAGADGQLPNFVLHLRWKRAS